MSAALADAYITVNAWHIVAGAVVIAVMQWFAFAIGDSHGYYRAPGDLRRKADEAQIQRELAEGREKAALAHSAKVEAMYAELKGAAVNLAWVARDGGKTKEAAR